MQIAPMARVNPRRSDQARAEIRPATPDRAELGALVDAITGQIIPKLVQTRPVAGSVVEHDRVPAIDENDIARFVRALSSGDEGIAEHVVVELLARGVPWQNVCLDLMAPAACRLGQFWESDTCNFTEVTLALGTLQRLLRITAPPMTPTSIEGGRKLLLAPAPGEQHTFGLTVVGDVFRRAGWHVQERLESGADELLKLARATWFDVAGFSVAGGVHLDRLARVIASLRAASINPRLCIMVGGSLFLQRPHLIADVGADAGVHDVRDAPGLADKLVATQTLARVGRAPVRKM